MSSVVLVSWVLLVVPGLIGHRTGQWPVEGWIEVPWRLAILPGYLLQLLSGLLVAELPGLGPVVFAYGFPLFAFVVLVVVEAGIVRGR